MKISFDCECVLLQETLKLFLKDYIWAKKDCDFVISDRQIQCQKPVFLISKNSGHLKLPFSKETLLATLEEFYSATQISSSYGLEKNDFESDLNRLLENFKRDLIKLMKAYS
ncbi:MAG: hypothetical protein ACTTJC_01100 [Campylobacter sp.]